MDPGFDRLKAALADRYQIERELGQGGMATVYLAKDLKHERRVAVKVLKPELAAVIGAERFLAEIKTTANLQHPHILPLFDSGQADGFLYYVMPYIEGESLRDRLDREKQLPVDEAVEVATKVAGALQAAHDHDVIHRDIKPANILLGNGEPLVADFGIALAEGAAGGSRLTETGLTIGSPGYMSPEQAAGGTEIDHRTDVYSLGCLVFEIMGGEPPFTGPTPQAILARVLTAPPPSLQGIRPAVPEGVARVVERALAKTPDDRFDTAQEFAEALALANTARAIAELARRNRQARRRRTVAGTLGVALLAAAGWWLSTLLGGPTIERLAVLPATNMTRDAEQDYFVDGVQEALVAELQRAGIPVYARQSALQYRDTEKSILQIAQELGVDALIQLSVGREGDEVVVDVSLIDGRSQLALWTETFDVELQGVLALYRDVSRRIAAEVGSVLSPEAEARLAERPVVDPRVLEAVMRGSVHLRTFTPQDLELALQYFESALAIDSLYAPAHLGVGTVWGYRAQAGMVPAMEAGPIVAARYAKAVAIDPDLPRARWSEASSTVWRAWDFDAGEARMRQAIELDPNDARAQVLYGHLLMILGRWDEAVRQGELAMEIDPLNALVVGLHGMILQNIGRTDEAIELLTDMLDRNPGASFGRAGLAVALHEVGRDEEAFAGLRRDHESRFGAAVVDAMDRGWREGGFPAASKAAADVLAARGMSPWTVASRYATAGEAESAIDWLEIGVEQRDQNMPYVGVMATFSELHDNPRFQDVARRVGVRLLKPEGM